MDEVQKNIISYIDNCKFAPELKDIRGNVDNFEIRGLRNLIIEDYISENEREREEYLNNIRQPNEKFFVYRLTEKGQAKNNGCISWIWYKFYSNPSAWIGIGSIILGIVTLLLSTYSLSKSVQIAEENFRVQKVMNRPFLYFDNWDDKNEVASSTNTLLFAIYNFGNLPAYNTKLEFFDNKFSYKSEWNSAGVIVTSEREIKGQVVMTEQIIDSYKGKDLNVYLYYADVYGNEYCTKADGSLERTNKGILFNINESLDCSVSN